MDVKVKFHYAIQLALADLTGATRAVADEAPAQRDHGGPTGGVLRRPIKCHVIATKRKTCTANKSSAVYQMGDRLATIDMGRKLGGVPPFSGGGGDGSPSNTMWPEPRPTSMPSFILVHPTVWPQYTNITDRQTGRDRQRSDSIEQTVLQTVAQN